MNLKTLSAIIIFIGCIVLLSGVYMQRSQSNLATETISPSEPVKNKKQTEITEVPKDKYEHLHALTNNADKKIQSLVKSRIEANKPLNFLIIGSNLMNKGDPGYADQLNEALNNSYGDFIKVIVQSFDVTSDTFIENLNDEIDFNQKYDIVLFEPFTLNNNGMIPPENQKIYISQFYDRLKEEVEDVVLVLHPSNPLPQAVYYPLEIESIENYAKSNDIPYINHWTYWPPLNSKDFINYLDKNGTPSNAGADAWASALISYFTAK